MQVIIEQIVSQIRAFDSELSERTLQRVVRAVLEGMSSQELQRERVAEETSLENHQGRTQPGRR